VNESEVTQKVDAPTEAALASLEEAIRERRIDKLMAAIQEAEGAGAVSVTLDDARRVLKDETRKVNARAQLQHAVESNDVGKLWPALREGMDACLLPFELRGARNDLAQNLEQFLSDAIQSRDRNKLQLAIEIAGATGAETHLLQTAQQVLEEEEEEEREV